MEESKRSRPGKAIWLDPTIAAAVLLLRKRLRLKRDSEVVARALTLFIKAVELTEPTPQAQEVA